MALLTLLRASQSAGLAGEQLNVLADSQYVINAVTTWAPNWKRRGWRKSDGKPVQNVDMMMALDTAMQGRLVKFTWVKGHAGHPLNEMVDELARAAATAFQDGHLPYGGPGFGGMTGAEIPMPAADTVVPIQSRLL